MQTTHLWQKGSNGIAKSALMHV